MKLETKDAKLYLGMNFAMSWRKCLRRCGFAVCKVTRIDEGVETKFVKS